MDLPDSWGNLRQLQTLNLKDTRICYLQKTITNLRRLQYLFAGYSRPHCFRRVSLAKLCVACCAPELLKDVVLMEDDPNRDDVCTFWPHIGFPALASRRLHSYGLPYGVLVPRGVGKLKDLRTLGVVNIAGGGKAVLRDIRKLTQLRKLVLTSSINPKDCSQELCSTLEELSCLESLSVKSTDALGLRDCLDGVSSPPKNLQSLKLHGNLGKLPLWIGALQSLVKLVLGRNFLAEVDATMQVLGKLPNLAILRLVSPFNYGEACLTFRREAFPSLMVLHLKDIYNHGSLEFEEAGTTPRLELLVLDHALNGTRSISGLSSLPSLKEVVIKPGISSREEEEVIGGVRDQVSRNPNNPVFKREWW